MPAFGLFSKLINPKKLAWLFLVMAVPQVIFFVAATPPMQTPDSVAHFFRTYQLFMHTSVTGNSVGVDSGIVQFAGPIASDMAFKYDHKLTGSALEIAKAARVSGVDIPANSTAPYPAWSYIPQLLAFALLYHKGALIYPIYELACLFNALSALLLTFYAIQLSRTLAPIIFTVALLPMTLMLFGSIGQDATIISTSFLLAAYLEYCFHNKSNLDRSQVFFICSMIVFIATARAPYVLVALVLFSRAIKLSPQPTTCGHKGYFVQTYRPYLRTVLFAVVLTASLVTIYICSSSNLIQARAPVGTSPSKQLLALLKHPISAFSIASQTLEVQGRFYIRGMVGILGWLDTYYSDLFYLLACAAFAASLILRTWTSSPELTSASFRWSPICLSSTALIVGGIFLAMFVDWTPLGMHVIQGVQGRYFLPLVPFLILGLPYFTRIHKKLSFLIGVRQIAQAMVVLFPCYTFWTTIHVVLARYYISG